MMFVFSVLFEFSRDLLVSLTIEEGRNYVDDDDEEVVIRRLYFSET